MIIAARFTFTEHWKQFSRPPGSDWMDNRGAVMHTAELSRVAGRRGSRPPAARRGVPPGEGQPGRGTATRREDHSDPQSLGRGLRGQGAARGLGLTQL